MNIRKATSYDSYQIIELIGNIYKEYGDRININRYDKDLTNLEKYYFSKGGYFWVVEDKKKVIATIAVKQKNKTWFEIKRVYLNKKYRGSGIADKMLNTACKWAKSHNFLLSILWSDVRYKRSHKFYSKNGFQIYARRKMFDADLPYEEFLFIKNCKKS